MRSILGIEASIEGVPVHGNTDPGILRAVLRRAGLKDGEIDSHMPEIVKFMCAEVQHNQEQLRPELCPSILELLTALRSKGKLLGAASGNLETIGWLKLERAGIRSMFSFGSFSFPRESRANIFQHGVDLASQSLGKKALVTIVGDTPSDIQAARAIGKPAITVATGVFSFDELMSHHPDACFSSATDLLSHS